MSRSQVRNGIASYFGGNTYDSVYRIYRPTPLISNGLAGVRNYFPKRNSDKDFTFGLPAGRSMGAVMVVNVPQQQERRIALGGATAGIKRDSFQIELVLFHMAQIPHAEDAQADFDDLLDAIVNRIHADRTLGGAVIEAGESPAGITKIMGDPVIGAGERTETYGVVRFDADTYISA